MLTQKHRNLEQEFYKLGKNKHLKELKEGEVKEKR